MREVQGVFLRAKSSPPRQLADERISFLSDIWAACFSTALEAPGEFDALEIFPDVSNQGVRQVMGKFPLRAAVGHVNLHPRALDTVSDYSIHAVILLLRKCEMLCSWPDHRLQTRFARPPQNVQAVSG